LVLDECKGKDAEVRNYDEDDGAADNRKSESKLLFSNLLEKNQPEEDPESFVPLKAANDCECE